MDRALTRAFVCKSGNDIDSQERLEGLTREKNDIRRPEGSILGPMWSGDSVVKNSGGKRVSGDTSWTVKKNSNGNEDGGGGGGELSLSLSPSISGNCEERIHDAVCLLRRVFFTAVFLVVCDSFNIRCVNYYSYVYVTY